MSNELINETSPYLLQHAHNPVNWYPWCQEAFDMARAENKPIFLSIGYSTCHWCHVMAHESFENKEIADILNNYFVSIKVDREERPDIDGVYMTVCQELTGNGGWPLSIFMTADGKPFFAGTYFAPEPGRGMISFPALLELIHESWTDNTDRLIDQANQLIQQLNINTQSKSSGFEFLNLTGENSKTSDKAVLLYKKIFDNINGGFGSAPKFPTPHNILFLLSYYKNHDNKDCLYMAEKTLTQMYRGGMFDHIGFGFCRYSTDSKFLVPHFEKMLYDNALLILAYCKVYECTAKPLYLNIAEKIAAYISREMTSPDGGFYSAQDADSEGSEGKYYLLTYNEIINLLGEKVGRKFSSLYDITEKGNFEGSNIPNLLSGDIDDKSIEGFLPIVYEYRKKRCELHIDDKILTAWNGLMIWAMCELYKMTCKDEYLTAAQKADKFISENLYIGDTLYVSFRKNKRGVTGFLDDYAAYIAAQIALYTATGQHEYLDKALSLCNKVLMNFKDTNSGFYSIGSDGQKLIIRLKESYDGALPSGNSLMALNLIKLSRLRPESNLEKEALAQLNYLSTESESYLLGHGMFLYALEEYLNTGSYVCTEHGCSRACHRA